MTGPLIDPELLKLATPQELEAYERAIRAQMALLSPLDYGMTVSPGLMLPFAHVKLLNQWLLALVEGRLYRLGPGPAPVLDDEGVWRHPETGEEPVYRLTISMPPRHGKSFMVSEHFPAWFLTKYPVLRLILASYEADFAASWGLKARNLVAEHPELGVEVDPNTRSGARWNIDGTRGGMVTAGAGGAITGKGAHMFVIDDPIKNAEEALSQTQRNSLFDWWVSTVFTRLEAWGCKDCGYENGPSCEHGKTPGRVILMNTRWHEDDLNGRVTAQEPTKWAVLNLPAVAESEHDQLGREPGKALCPQLFNEKQLADIKSASTSYWWAAMYQGRPNIEGGGLIARPFRYHKLMRPAEGTKPGVYELTDFAGTTSFVPEAACYRFATMDVAGSVKTQADWTVFSVWDLTPEGILLLHDRQRNRMEQADHEEVLRSWYEQYPRISFVGIEDKTFGTYLIKNIVRFGGIAVRPLKADTDKIARAIPYGAQIQQGKVSFPKDAPWLHEWEHEHLQFPNGTHDDQVDTGAYAVQIQLLMPTKRPPKREPETLEERVEAHVQRKLGKAKRRRSHPMLGRM